MVALEVVWLLWWHHGSMIRTQCGLVFLRRLKWNLDMERWELRVLRTLGFQVWLGIEMELEFDVKIVVG